MNTIQKIMNILMKPNATLTNIIILPFFVIEVYLYVNLFITLLNITPSKKSKYSCMLSLIAIFIISRFLIPVPFNTIFNILIFVLLYLLFFKRPLIDTFLGIIIPFLLTTLFEIISSQVYTLIFNKPYTEAISLPLYHILFLIIVYSLLFIIWKLFKHLKLNITLFTNLNKKDSFSILSTVILGFITIFLQLYITAFYNNVLPGAIILLSIMCLVAYVFVSIFNIVKTKELEVANRDIKNLKLYNIRAFKHDFHNIMNGIGRIYNCQ